MLDFITNAIIWILAIYGLIEIIKTIYYIYTYSNVESNGIYFIIAVKNEEERIEGIMRSMLFRILYGKEECIKKILVADLGSTDNTNKILEKLQNDYNCIKLVDWKTCKELVDSMDKNVYK